MSELKPAELDGDDMMAQEDDGKCYEGEAHRVDPELQQCLICGMDIDPVGATVNGITYKVRGDVDGFLHLAGLVHYRESMTKEREYRTTRFALVKTASGNPHILPYMDVDNTDEVLAIADVQG